VPFDFQPVLAGPLLELRPLAADDYDAVRAAAADPLIWAQHPEPERWREERFEPYFAMLLASGETLVARDAASGEVVGLSRYHGYDAERSEVEIGWTFLVRTRWGGTWNRELKRLMLEHAFRFVDEVVFLVGPQNVRSQRALEKLGARRIADRRNDVGRPSVAFAIGRPEFERWGATAG
jgi:RimJ/RimL family protein N-acetyltransferase